MREVIGCRASWIVMVTCLMAGAAPARADDSANPPRSVRGLIRMAFDFGGDELATVTWSDGDTANLKSSELATLEAGALYHPADAWYTLEATIGYKFDKLNGKNGSIEFGRFPLQLIGSFAYGGHRIGAGATVHFAPKFGCQVTGLCSDDIQYDTAIGAVGQYAFNWSKGNLGLDVGVRYTVIRYRRAGLVTLNGGGPGFFFGFAF